MKMSWEIEEAVNGFRVNIYPEDMGIPVWKENPETRLEGLQVIMRSVQKEIAKEQYQHGRLS